ncbi:hypothetical protein JTB14_031705 [Gonioctena quinquepunctata]|nr:hypothetical protein JTB14_031705 [Gonioctena quinquepunctata]
MVLRSFSTGVFIITSLYLLLTYQFGIALGAPGSSSQESHRSRNGGFGRYRPPQYARIKNEPFINDFIVDDDDIFEFSKRQGNSDDYGHMRFGRKGEEVSDDYGHMRFGRSNAENK